MPYFYSHSHGGRGRIVVPWHFWGRHRGTIGIYVLSAITTIACIVDLVLIGAHYKEEIGFFAYLLIYLDAIILLLQAMHLASAFKLTWMVCGYYAQMMVLIMFFITTVAFRLPVSIAIPNSIKTSSSSSIYLRKNVAIDVIVVGAVSTFVEFIAFTIWSATISSSAAMDPEYIAYRAKLIQMFLGLTPQQLVIPYPYPVPMQMPAPTGIQPQGVAMGYPVATNSPRPEAKRENTMDQINTLQAQLDVLKQRQELQTCATPGCAPTVMQMK